jgi:hypothetical protein
MSKKTQKIATQGTKTDVKVKSQVKAGVTLVFVHG